MRYAFEWNPVKANDNAGKHGIAFERASTIFLDAKAISIFDTEHSQGENRWITIGIDSNGVLLVIIHTFNSR